MHYIKIYGTQEFAGTFWRFFGPTYKTPEAAQLACDERKARGWGFDIKVATIWRAAK